MVEMMISITIGLLIVAALVGVLISSSGSTKTNDRTAEIQSNGRYGLDHLKRELREAGYRGYTAQAPQSGIWTTPTIAGECGTAGSFVKNIRQAVWGKNDSNPFTANCIPAASYLQGDVLVIRSAANTATSSATAVANTLYLRSSYATASVLQGSALPATITTGTDNFALQEYVYYISPFTNSVATTGVATESPQVPALYRVSLQANGSMTPELVVTGIEHMQIEFGVANTDGTTQYFSASSIGSSTDHSATGATSWDQISLVRIWLLSRNSKAETGYSNTSSYVMGDQTYTVNDSFRRQVFTSVIQLRNFRNSN